MNDDRAFLFWLRRLAPDRPPLPFEFPDLDFALPRWEVDLADEGFFDFGVLPALDLGFDLDVVLAFVRFLPDGALGRSSGRSRRSSRLLLDAPKVGSTRAWRFARGAINFRPIPSCRKLRLSPVMILECGDLRGR
ncbi:hypothetical protein [Roseibium sp.]|uniref:hypothetical protein n=1 Tax=Roseibium sp. TaxID=1936156 RepID=UPI003BAB8D6A